jgi:hypothetical protein
MKKIIFSIIAAALMFSACTKETNTGSGRIVVKVTDDPFNISFVESATVTITKVEIRQKGPHDGNPFIVLSEEPKTFNLLDLRNGITAELLNLEIPQGSYDLIRLYVDEASLKIKDQAGDFKVKIPGGSQTGIKIFITPSLTVEGGLTSELILDFDLARSFVMKGNMSHSAGINGFNFKPVIRVTNNSTAGRIEGKITDAQNVKIIDAKVWISQDTVAATAFTDDLGNYAFIGVPAGTYSVSAVKENYDTLTFQGIKVLPGNRTIQDFILQQKQQ